MASALTYKVGFLFSDKIYSFVIPGLTFVAFLGLYGLTFKKRLFDDRNHAMTDKLTGYLRQGGSYFVVVGAGHLVGEQGIVRLLEKRGYKPEQI